MNNFLFSASGAGSQSLDAYGNPTVSIGRGQQTAFGELLAANLTPVIQESFPYNINSRVWSKQLGIESATITTANGMVVVSTGTDPGSTATLTSLRKIRYRAGQGILVRFTALFSPPAANTVQLIGLGDTADGLFVGYNGLQFGVMRRSSTTGSPVDTWVYEPNWNGYPLVLDYEKGNVFQIKFQYLGFGAITYYVENPSNNELQPIHTINYTNRNTEPSMQNPTLPFTIYTKSDEFGTDIDLKCASVGCFVEGDSSIRGIPESIDATKNITTSGACVITLRNKATYQSQPNRSVVYPTQLSLGTVSGSRPAILRLILNGTLVGTPVWNDIETQTSCIEYDTTATNVSDGTVLFTSILPAAGSALFDLSRLKSFLNTSDTLSVYCETVANNIDVSAALSWLEDI